MVHLGGGARGWPLPESASIAAFCMTDARRGLAGPDFELAHGLLDEHVQARNDRLALFSWRA